MAISPTNAGRLRHLYRIAETLGGLALLIFLWTRGEHATELMREHRTASCLIGWAVGMLSYRQEASGQPRSFAYLSQFFACIMVIALVVFLFKYRDWANLFILPPVIWLHIEFTKRWWARPGAWW